MLAHFERCRALLTYAAYLKAGGPKNLPEQKLWQAQGVTIYVENNHEDFFAYLRQAALADEAYHLEVIQGGYASCA